MDRVASKQGIEVTDKETTAEIVRIARTTQEGPAELKARLAKTGRLQGLMEELRYRKTVDQLLAQVRVEEEAEDLEKPSEESEEGK